MMPSSLLRSTRRLAFVGAAMVASTLSAQAGPNLVTNGNFDSVTGVPQTCGGSGPCDGSQVNYAGYTSNSNIVGWTNTSTYAYVVSTITSGTITLQNVNTDHNSNPGTISMYSFPSLSPTGTNFYVEDSNYSSTTGPTSNPGGVSQQVSGLSVGQTYQVGFYEAAAQQKNYTGSTTDNWQVSFGASTQAPATAMSIPQAGFSGWIYQTLNFVATSAIQTLSFNAIGTGQPPFIALDGVSVVQVPEPGTWLLVGGGLLALTFARRRLARRA